MGSSRASSQPSTASTVDAWARSSPYTSMAPTLNAGSSSGRPDSRMRLVLSLLSATFGWSNGLIPSRRPATAVAYSHARNWAPSGPLTATCGVTPAPGTAPGGSAPPTVAVSTSGPVIPGLVGDSTTTGRAPRPSLPGDP